MFISDTKPSNAQTVFLEPVDGTVSSDDTVRSNESAISFSYSTTSVRLRTIVRATKLRLAQNLNTFGRVVWAYAYHVLLRCKTSNVTGR